VDFGVDRILSEVELYFLDDEAGPAAEAVGEEEESGFPSVAARPGVPILPPARYEALSWNPDTESWEPIPGQERSPAVPEGRRANRVRFPELATSRIRVVLYHREGATSGLTELEAWGRGDLPFPSPVGPVTNLAWNPGDLEYPRVRASFSNPPDPASQATDGRLALTRYSRNRWTAYTSPNLEDWLEVGFGASKPVGRVDLFFFADGRGVAAPEDYRIELWEDGWVEIHASARHPADPLAWAQNTVTFDQITTDRLRVVFRHALPAATGVTEIRVWPD
jgi:hypothetical protein